MTRNILRIVIPIVATIAVLGSMGGTWRVASATPPVLAKTGSGAVTSPTPIPPKKPAPQELAGKLNLNTASEEQLLLLPTVGPSKAERIVAWRKKNGGFKRTADIRRVKGFGYKTFKRLEPFLDIAGENTLARR